VGWFDSHPAASPSILNSGTLPPVNRPLVPSRRTAFYRPAYQGQLQSIAGIFAVVANTITVRRTESYWNTRDLREIEAIKASLGVEIKAFLNVLQQAHEVRPSS